jgi:hypothetical protein
MPRCGWGSGALYYAEVLPGAQVVAFSNSKTQKEYIDGKAKEKGLTNLEVITGNVVNYEFEHESFDRIVSIEVSLFAGDARQDERRLTAGLDVRTHEELRAADGKMLKGAQSRRQAFCPPFLP